MKKITFLLSGLILGASLAAAQTQDAASIVEASRNRIDAQTTSTRSRMVITAKNGSTTERTIDQYSKDGPNGARTVIVFQNPASVRNTRFLTMDKAGGGTDQWIFLPSLGKVRRIAASEGSGNFMGTDMSYDDMSAASREASEDTHTLLREESYGGVSCYVIQSVPKDSSFQYSKTISWIEKDTYCSRKIEMYDKRGALAKVMESSQYEDVQGRLTPKVMKMSTVSADTSTTVYTELIKYDDAIPESVFTTTYLETGRAR